MVLISTSGQPTPLIKLITIPNVSNHATALVFTVLNWTINSIWTILIEIISIIPKVIYTMPIIMSSIKIISSIIFMLIPSRTGVTVFKLRLLMWIYHLIICICVIFIILTPSNCWINFNDVGFDTVYPFFWFWCAEIKLFFLSKDVGFWLGFLSLLIAAGRSLCDDDLTPFLFLSPMSWLFLH